MSITDELREYARHLHNVWYDPRGNVYTYTTMDNAPSLDAVRLDEHVLAIADRIDAEHAELAAKSDRQRGELAAMEDALRRRNEGELKRRWQREIDALRDERDELREAVRLSEAKASDMVELPKDADGKVIRIGDVMEFIYDPPQDQPLFEVSGFGADGTLFYAPRGEVLPRKTTKASVVRHHKQSTVEDVLYDSLKHFGAVEKRTPEVDSWVCEQAAKLREMLAGEGE